MDVDIRKFNSIDLAKFIMAFFVVAIHTKPLAGCNMPIIGTVYDCIVSCAVPYFFLSCGFLLAQKKNMSSARGLEDAISHHIVKIVKMYLLWSALYLPLAIYYFLVNDYSLGKSVWSYLRGLLLVGENYNSWMLWYLLSSIYALIFVLLLIKRKMKIVHIVWCGCAVFLAGTVITSFVGYDGQLPEVLLFIKKGLSATIINGRIFTGFLYIPLGMFLAKRKISPYVGGVLFLLGFIGNFLFEHIIGSLMVAVCSTGVFIVINQIKIRDSFVYPILRNASTGIYLIHMYVWTVYYSLVYGKVNYGVDSFIVTSGISFILSILFAWISHRKRKQVVKQ